MGATVYLIHLDAPIHHAQHYLGAAKHLSRRFAHHQNGSGARLLQVANLRGITYQIVRTWKCKDFNQAKQLEKHYKKWHNSPKLCPICNKKG